MSQDIKYPISCVRNVENSYEHSLLFQDDTDKFILQLGNIIVRLSNELDKEYGADLGKLAIDFQQQ